MGTTARGLNRSSSLAKIGTTKTTGTAVAATIKGSAVVGQTARKAASRNAFAAT
jgi:hypothetical protein